MSSITVDSDRFAMALEEILGGVENHITGRLEHVVGKTCEYCKDVVESESPRRYGGYSKGWRYTMKPQSSGCVGEVGNAKYPGLVHLLEKGHARVGGGRVRAIPHVSTAYDQSAVFFDKVANDLVDEALYQ